MSSPQDGSDESGFVEACRLERVGALREAAGICDRLLAECPSHFEALRLRAAIASQCGEALLAIQCLRRARALRSGDARVHLGLGRLLRERGELGEAEREIRAACRAEPGLGVARFELARLCSSLGETTAAIEHYEQAAADPELARSAHHNRASLLWRIGQLGDAAEAYRAALVHASDDAANWRGLARVLHALGRSSQACKAYEQLRQIDPADAEAEHMAAALAGRRPRQCPPAYVRELFDEHAERFEQLLVEGLDYRTPALLAELIREARPGAVPFARAVDLGCGTGLLGVELRPLAGLLAGVDLSPAMLDRARAKMVYDELRCEGIEAWLGAQPSGRWDLIAAADVLPYLGELDALVGSMRSAIARAGLVALSVEVSDERGYRLGRSGRFAHHPEYLREVARGQSLRIVAEQPVPLRREGDTLVAGHLMLLAAG